MKRADEAIDKVLAGLREVEASAGFEEKMVRRVREAARERGAGGWFGVCQWVGVGCVTMLLVGFGVNVRRHERPDVSATNVGFERDARVQAGPGGAGAIEEGVPHRLKPGNGMQGDGTAEAVPLTRTGSSGRANSSRNVGSSEVAGGLGTGFPAPPLPLTVQERLLLRAARGGDPQPVAVFEVSVLPGQDAEETAAFVEFFGKPEEVGQAVEQAKEGEIK